jgi:hypothetical protein
MDPPPVQEERTGALSTAARVGRLNGDAFYVDWMIAQFAGEPYSELRTRVVFLFLSGAASAADLKGKC